MLINNEQIIKYFDFKKILHILHMIIRNNLIGYLMYLLYLTYLCNMFKVNIYIQINFG